MVPLKQEARQVAFNLGSGFVSIWTYKERSLISAYFFYFINKILKTAVVVRGKTASSTAFCCNRNSLLYSFQTSDFTEK